MIHLARSLALSVLLISSCQLHVLGPLLGRVSLLQLPELDVHVWRLTYPATDQGIRRRMLTSGDSLQVADLYSGPGTPVLAEALDKELLPIAMPAGGFIDPDALASGVLQLSWEDGPAALIALTALAEGWVGTAFNGGRLRRECHELHQGQDVWALDVERALDALRAGSFWVRDLRLADAEDLVVQLDGPGWRPLDMTARYSVPAGPPWRIELQQTAGSRILIETATGRRRFAGGYSPAEGVPD